jgi:uncharacterized damage-inducible protein DinB
VTVDLVRVLYDYDAWATERVLEAAGRLTTEQLLASAGAPHGSIRDTLIHPISTLRNWLKWWSGALPADQAQRLHLAPTDFPDLAAVRAIYAEVQAELRAFLARLDEADVERVLSQSMPDGTVFRMRLWQLMLHVANHNTQHRSEAAMLLTAAGASPGDLDLIFYLWPDGEARFG